MSASSTSIAGCKYIFFIVIYNLELTIKNAGSEDHLLTVLHIDALLSLQHAAVLAGTVATSVSVTVAPSQVAV